MLMVSLPRNCRFTVLVVSCVTRRLGGDLAACRGIGCRDGVGIERDGAERKVAVCVGGVVQGYPSAGGRGVDGDPGGGGAVRVGELSHDVAGRRNDEVELRRLLGGNVDGVGRRSSAGW